MPSAAEIRRMAKKKHVNPKNLSKQIYGNLRKTSWKKEHEKRMKLWKAKYEKKYGKYTITKARKLGLLPPKESRPWKPPKHGTNSRYFHVRIDSPSKFDEFRTITVGKVKHVYARDKKTKLFRPQNVLIPKNLAEVKDNHLHIKKSIIGYIKKIGINPDGIVKMRTGGSSDFKVVSCPGAKIRSRGRGRGLGIGKGKGPIGRHKYE